MSVAVYRARLPSGGVLRDEPGELLALADVEGVAALELTAITFTGPGGATRLEARCQAARTSAGWVSGPWSAWAEAGAG